MNIKPKRGLLTAGLYTSALMAMILTASPPPAQAADSQGYPTALVSITNLPTVLTNGQGVALTNYIPLYQGRGAAIQAQWVNPLSTNGYQTYYISPSVDGTNAWSTNVWQWKVVSSGSTTNQFAATNWSRGALDGFVALIITAITNSSANWTNYGMIYSVPNL